MNTRKIAVLIAFAACLAQAADFNWQKPHAKVLPNGDLEWAPQAFEFKAGKTVRYIDYENGDDNADGSRTAPWKHHPWDSAARGKAKSHNGPTTYVFKRGVIYRGTLKGGGKGTADNPLRLTSDPKWGTGYATIAGSHAVTGGWKRGGAGLPDGVPERDKIWYVDLPRNVQPRCVWAVDGETVTRLYLARIPNWNFGDDANDNIKSSWFRSNKPGRTAKLKGRNKNLLLLDPDLPKDPAFYEGANVYSEWGPVMGTAAPETVEKYDARSHGVISHGFFPNGTKKMFGGQRYYLDNNPHYLDQGGEFWLSKKGRLYLRLPGDVDPNTVRIEAGKDTNLINLESSDYVEISGLVFRFTNMPDRGAWPWTTMPEVIHFNGSGKLIRIANNRFEYVNAAATINGASATAPLEQLVICDNDIQHTDNGGIRIDGGKSAGGIGEVKLLRNRIYRAGMWMERMSHGHCVTVNGAVTAEIAGNILHRVGGWGISVRPSKGGGPGDWPFTRCLIHHNKVVDPLLFSNDWGGIECWQGGPIYVYNNVVGNPVGYMWGGRRRFGHAYYLDGSFKNYHFNNIAWAESSTPKDHEASASAFQEIHSYQNTWFNNTVYQFLNGSRRQNPGAGRDKFLGNIFQDIGDKVFRHSDSKNEDPNAHDAGEQGDHFAYETNAYSKNVLYDISGEVGNFHALGGDYKEIAPFAAALAKEHTMASDIGVMADKAPLRDPANGDFRPAPGSAAIDRGAMVFVPWALYGVVGEWNFTRNQKDPNIVIDEHWYMRDYYISRTEYHNQPMYPLHGAGLAAKDYSAGPLENWTDGMLTLDGQKQYLSVSHDKLAEPIEYTVTKGKRKNKVKEKRVAEGKTKPTLDIHEQNFLIEVYLRTTDADGTLVQKQSGDAGYALKLSGGKPQLSLRSGGKDVVANADASIADGNWRHLIVEVDRKSGVRFYIDGKAAGEGKGLAGSLNNSADFLVGGGPNVDGLAMSIDFLRVAHGTLKDAHTSIEELYVWQFDGPQFRDFTGARPNGKRDAGAIEAK